MSDVQGLLSLPARPTDGGQSVNPSERAADLHFRSAEEAARRGEYDRAAAEYTYSIQLDPS